MAKKFKAKERIAMWSALLALFTSVPKLLDMVDRFSKWINEQVRLIREEQAIKNLNKASEKAKKSKDTTDLDKMFRGDS